MTVAQGDSWVVTKSLGDLAVFSSGLKAVVMHLFSSLPTVTRRCLSVVGTRPAVALCDG
jgi:hypothetical protein